MLALKARVLLLGAVFIAAAISASARAQDYPTRPVEIIVPFAAGGGSELLARLISDGLSKRLGQPFVVLNRPVTPSSLELCQEIGKVMVVLSSVLKSKPPWVYFQK